MAGGLHPRVMPAVASLSMSASKTEVSSIIRVHNFDTLYFAMAALLAPMNLLEEPEKLDAPPDISKVEWPDVAQGRPSA